ncbi:TPA: Cof-type HAD-IIB family hydrolase [Streptococcus agalactiae]
MSDIKILALDLDGTLFTTDKKVSEENKVALKAAREKGIKVVITTGRPLKAIGNLLEDLELVSDEDYSITFNGGLVQQNTGKILTKTAMTRQEVEDIHEELYQVGLPTDILSEGTVYSIANKGHHSQYHLANPLLEFIEVDDLEQVPKDVVYNKIVSVIDATYLDQQIAKLPDRLKVDYEMFKSRDIILELMPKGVHKAVGLELLTKHLGLDSSQVMAMGDEANDLSMLEWAGLGVAMANGIPEAKAIAKATTICNNDESGVAEAIGKYILSEEN